MRSGGSRTSKSPQPFCSSKPASKLTKRYWPRHDLSPLHLNVPGIVDPLPAAIMPSANASSQPAAACTAMGLRPALTQHAPRVGYPKLVLTGEDAQIAGSADATEVIANVRAMLERWTPALSSQKVRVSADERGAVFINPPPRTRSGSLHGCSMRAPACRRPSFPPPLSRRCPPFHGLLLVTTYRSL